MLIAAALFTLALSVPIEIVDTEIAGMPDHAGAATTTDLLSDNDPFVAACFSACALAEAFCCLDRFQNCAYTCAMERILCDSRCRNLGQFAPLEDGRISTSNPGGGGTPLSTCLLADPPPTCTAGPTSPYPWLAPPPAVP